MKSAELYCEYKTKMQKIADVKYASAVLQWDQETYLPPKGNTIRGKQIATLNEIAHQQFTDVKVGAMLNELAGKDDLTGTQKRNVQLSLEDYKGAIQDFNIAIGLDPGNSFSYYNHFFN